MTYPSSHVVALAKVSLIMATESGELSGWREMLIRMGEEVAALRNTWQANHQELDHRLSALHARSAVDLTEDQRRFVAALAEHRRLLLLPEIATLFCELAATEESSADVGSEARVAAFERPKAATPDMESVLKSIQLVDVPAAIESIEDLKQRVCSNWGSRELASFLHSHVMDAMEGDRMRYSLAVANEVGFLSDLNRMVRAIDLAAACDITVEEAYQHVEESDRQFRGDDAADQKPFAPGAVMFQDRDGPVLLHDTDSHESSSELLEFIDLMVKLATNRIAIGLIVLILVAKLIFR